MAETKHAWTPGEWRVDVDPDDGATVITGGPDGGLFIATAHAGLCDGQTEANAHLLANSKKLYEALEEAREHILLLIDGPCDPDDAEALRQIDAALSAARGESHG